MVYFLQNEEDDLGKGGSDSEAVGETSFQPRRKLWSDSDCGFSLFAIMDKQTGSQRVGLVEGDTHSCGRRTSEPGRVEVNETVGGGRRHAGST